MGFFSKKQKPAVEQEAAMVFGHVGGDGSFGYEVVGESRRFAELRQIIAAASSDERADGEVFDIAYLMPEPDNAFDPRAVRVFIADKQVGYIPRSGTDLMHELIEHVKGQGYAGVSCDARIGWDAENPDPPIGVRLDMVIGYSDESDSE